MNKNEQIIKDITIIGTKISIYIWLMVIHVINLILLIVNCIWIQNDRLTDAICGSYMTTVFMTIVVTKCKPKSF